MSAVYHHDYDNAFNSLLSQTHFRRLLIVTPTPPHPNTPSHAPEWQELTRRLHIYLLAAVGNHHDAEDLMQRVSAIAMAKQSHFDPDKGSYLNWIFGIARYEILMYKRKKASSPLILQDDILKQLAAAVQPIAETSDRIRHLNFCLKKLAPKAQDAIRLCYGEDLSAHQAASKMGLTRKHLNVILYRARLALRQCIVIQEKGLAHDRS